MVSFIRVISLLIRISWQVLQPIWMAECTDLPLAFLCVTFQTLGRVHAELQGNGMSRREYEARI